MGSIKTICFLTRAFFLCHLRLARIVKNSAEPQVPLSLEVGSGCAGPASFGPHSEGATRRRSLRSRQGMTTEVNVPVAIDGR